MAPQLQTYVPPCPGIWRRSCRLRRQADVRGPGARRGARAVNSDDMSGRTLAADHEARNFRSALDVQHGVPELRGDLGCYEHR
ncbi:MAG: hypothetical protein QOJ93_1661 [Actinomycetota bacterium]|nr:hypothetical protein [Actinomycetota bacterium]